MTKAGQVDCPYCGRRYIQTEEGKRGGGHGH
jgi:uncharacterized Zn finger protein (UPF0148 family)